MPENTKSGKDRGSHDEIPLQTVETLKEDEEVAVPPASPIGRRHTEASLFPSCCKMLSACPKSQDLLDAIGCGESLPKLYRRGGRRLRTLNTSLLDAVESRDVAQVERLLNQGANPNATCSVDCVSACHLAVLAGADILALLLSRGAETSRQDRLGRTPLHVAAWEGGVQQIAMLLDVPKGLQKRMKNTISQEALDAISSGSHSQLANVRCGLGDAARTLPKDWQDNVHHYCKGHEDNLPLLQPGWTPLHAASANARPQAVRLLLAAGADPYIRDFVERSALDVAGMACYSGQAVDARNFEEVIKLLLKSHPRVNLSKTITPLHTAVEVECVGAIQLLLDAGASVASLNRDGQTPMHVCVRKQLKEHLQVLLCVRGRESRLPDSLVDERDRNGRTVLQCAILAGWAPGVSVALEAGANILTMTQDGETPIHLAAGIGNLDILEEILSVAKSRNYDIDCRNSKGETPLCTAVLAGHLDTVKRLLKDGACIEVTLPKGVNLFHIAAESGYSDILQVLLDHNYKITREKVNFLTNTGFGPIHYAVLNNHLKCVKALLSKNAYVSLRATQGPFKQSTPLHLAAMKNNIEIAKVLVKFDSEIVHNVNHLNWTPFHTAIHHKSRDVISFLIAEGADLSACTGGPVNSRKTAVNMIMNNLSQPTEFFEELFDSYIKSNDLGLQDPYCEITVSYDVILPKKSGRGQIAVIEEIIKTGNRHDQTKLLLHPLVESFLYLKWKALLPIFYIIAMVYGAFVVSLTIFVLSAFFFKDIGIHAPVVLDPHGWSLVVLVTSILWLSQEIIFLTPSRRYFLQLETWIKFISVALALIVRYNAVQFTKDLEWVRHVATMAVLLSWVELMFLLSRFPKWGYYVPMFRKVSCKVAKILLAFAFLIIGFSISFLIEFHSQVPFENPFAALVKTMVMMTSEFDYDDLIDKEKKAYLPASLLTIRLVFLAFLFFTSIVLMNLMVGVAVNDLQNLELRGNIRRLEKQVELLVSLESLADTKFFKKILTSTMLNKFTVKSEINLFPSDNSRNTNINLPKNIINAIFNIVQTQKKHTVKELDSKAFKQKLDQVYNTVVSQDNPGIVIEKYQDEVKKHIDSCFEKSQNSVEVLNKKLDEVMAKLDKLVRRNVSTDFRTRRLDSDNFDFSE